MIPNELKIQSESGNRVALNPVWNRRQCSKFNGASYISQRGAEAVFSAEGYSQTRATIQYYLTNAQIIRDSLSKSGLEVFGGENAPYIWVRTPGVDSWTFFDRLLHNAQVVVTPGAGFGPSGEGYIRICYASKYEQIKEALDRMERAFGTK